MPRPWVARPSNASPSVAVGGERSRGIALRLECRRVLSGKVGSQCAQRGLRGQMKVICEKDGQKWEATLGERDLISVPPGVYREEHNTGEEDALMCVMLGSPKPITPVYPPDSPLAKIKR